MIIAMEAGRSERGFLQLLLSGSAHEEVLESKFSHSLQQILYKVGLGQCCISCSVHKVGHPVSVLEPYCDRSLRSHAGSSWADGGCLEHRWPLCKELDRLATYAVCLAASGRLL